MIKIKEKIGYGFGDMAFSMFWKFFGAYMLIFYTDIFGMPAAAVGTMMLATRLWDTIFDPFVGVMADRTTSKWGKFRPYLLYLAIPFGIIGVLTFTTPALGLTARIVYAYVTYSLMMMVYSAMNVPYASMLGVMSADPKERNILSTYRMIFAYIGSFIALLFFKPLVVLLSGKNPSLTDKQHAWMLATAVFAVLAIALFYFCFRLTKERVKPIKEEQASGWEDVLDLLTNKPWFILLGAGIAALIFNSIRDGATVFYFQYYILENSNHVTICGIELPFILSGLYLALGQAANILGIVLAAPLSNKIGKKAVYLWAMLLATILSIIFFWFTKDDLVLIFVFQVLISMCAGSIFPILWSMYADCADYSELKTGNRATGLVFSSSSMSQKLGWALGSGLIGFLLAYFGYVANQAVQSPETIQGLRMLLSFFPAIGTALSVIFIWFYPLSEKKVEEITKELEIRKQQAATV